MAERNYLATGTNYAKRVVSGKEPTPYYTKLQCQKYLGDLNPPNRSRWRMSKAHANHVCLFIETQLRLPEGAEGVARQPFKLLPFQIFFLVNVFGFLDKKNPAVRMVQEAIMFIPRKNGKSMLAGGIAIYDLLFGEYGGQVFTAATILRQAKIVYKKSMAMINLIKSDTMRARFRVTELSIRVKDRNSEFMALASNSKTQDGFGPTLAIFDESAQIEDRGVFEKMESGTHGRRSFTRIHTTTAHTVQTTNFYEVLKYAEENLKIYEAGGQYTNPDFNERLFLQSYHLEEGDDWTDTKLWKKANPALGEALFMDSLESYFKKSKSRPSYRVDFKTKILNIWEKSSDTWLDMQEWDQCAIPDDEMYRAGDLYISVDLAETRDLACVGMLFVRGGKRYYDYQCFYPRDSLPKLSDTTRAVFELAVEKGRIFLTDEPLIDPDDIVSYLHKLKLDPAHRIRAIGFDPYHSHGVQKKVDAAIFKSVKIQQGMMALSDATRVVERYIAHKDINIINDPFLKWQAENCVLTIGKNKNIKVEKGADKEKKIDAMICLIMCVNLEPEAAPTFESHLFSADDTDEEGLIENAG